MQSTDRYKFPVPCYLLMGICFVMLCASCNKNTRPGSIGSKNDSLSFVVVGDWGRNGTANQKAVADQMDVYARKFNAKFILTTGDNFYEIGVANTTDPHWKNSFENVYNKEGHQVAWFPTLGNHDYGLNPQAQIEYSTVSTRWKMPARYYAVEKKIDSSHAVFFAFTDTSPFVSSYYGRSMADLEIQDTAAQLRWLRQALNSSNATWKIAVGHHPVYSSGLHGNTSELISYFKPIFLQSKTDFYLCGHDHSLEHRIQPNERIHYLVSGGGAGSYPVFNNPNSLFARGSSGFLVMTLYADKANIYFYNEKGDLLYRKQVTR
jgi:hypothetical protein